MKENPFLEEDLKDIKENRRNLDICITAVAIAVVF
jgi:hypothetical protein